VKKLLFVFFVVLGIKAMSQQTVEPTASKSSLRKAEKRARINQLIKQEEEGALIFLKQSAFGLKLSTDGWGISYEIGKYKTVTKTNLWWVELGEHKHPKEESITSESNSQGFIFVSNYIYGKINNFYYLKAGFGQQLLIGGKGNKNGVAVSGIYGGGLTLGLLKPYYLEMNNRLGSKRETIKYTPENEDIFLNLLAPDVEIIGKSGIFKGLSETKIVPGVHVKGALRFDYGRYNEVLSAVEVGVNAEFYSQKMPMILFNDDKNFFFNAYVAITFGNRK
jgi:hypothetical protein